MTVPRPQGQHAAFFGLVLFLCILLVYSTWYPGIFTQDERDILGQALSGHLHDGHSPLLVKFWGLTQYLKPGPAIPYLTGVVVAVLAAASLLRQALRSTFAAAASLCCLILLPPVCVSLGLVTKDLFFIGAMLTVMLGVVRHVTQPRQRHLVFTLGAALLAVMVRIDAVFALLPILSFLAWQAAVRRHPGRMRALLLAGVCTVSIVLALVGVSKLIAKYAFHTTAYHAEQVSMLFDLAAISVETDQMLIPASRLGPDGFPLPMLRARFKTGSADAIIWSSDAHHLVYAPGADHGELHRAWVKAIAAHPREYLLFRAEYAANFIGIRNNEDWLRAQFSGDASMTRDAASLWEQSKAPLQALYQWLSASPSLQIVYLPWCWLLGALFPLFVFGVRQVVPNAAAQAGNVAVLLIASAFSYTLAMGLVSAAAIGRYHSWPRMAIGMAIVLAAAELVRHVAKARTAAGTTAVQAAGVTTS